MAKSTSKLFENEEPKEMKKDALNIPEEVKEEVKEETIPESQTEVVATPPVSADDIQDVDLSVIKKKRFRINGDNNRILELNTSDLNILSRLTTAYDRLQNYMTEVGKILSGLPDDELTEDVQRVAAEQLKAIDANMRKELDYIFDAPVSKVCDDGGSMYDPYEGAFKFEHIIEAVLKLYERNLDSEFSKIRKRVSSKTSKYTKKYHN